MNFRKMLSIIMVAVLCLTLFSGCGEDKNAGDNATTSTTGPAAVSGKTITLVGGMGNMGFYENLKKGGEVDFNFMSEALFVWSKKWIDSSRVIL